ncbi:hypothetical protein [Nocardioides aquaticus]|uniref:hypothetical protein n=1 Tax=Nocardioides aquaticus TaxID=160826 RepID=UPI001BD2EDF7|nr:hypothetical protein [Nocardioides aquaticus]
MTYDELGESIRLIEGVPVAGRERLTRRRRFLPVAVDVDHDVAVTIFLRRAHGGAEFQEHTLARTGEGWRRLGGGGWGVESLDELTSVPTFEELGGYAAVEGGGSSSVSLLERPASGARWVHHALIRTTGAVTAVTVGAERVVTVPEHGRVAVVWRDRPQMQVSLLGPRGEVFQRLKLSAVADPADLG